MERSKKKKKKKFLLSSEEEQKEKEGALGRGALETSWEFGTCVMVAHLGSLKSFHSLERK